MEFWIYDENGWPSGSGDGKVREHFPERFCQWVVWKDGSAVIEKKQAFNTFDREQMQYFIRVVYDGYCQGLEPEAFQYVTGFFSDEVGFLDGHGVSMDQGGIPWCAEAEERMEVQFGETEKWLDLLFCEKEGFREVRSHYWEILTDILSESFYGAVNDWCEAHGKRYTAHLKGEENLFFQIPCSGSCFEQLKMINTPAVDALERYPGNHYYPRIASSVSRQFGDGECLAEALGGSGWGLTPENVTDYVDWLAECGINRFAFHLWQYERNSASVRDWPPNIPWGMNWKDSMAPLLGSLRRKWNQAFLRQENRCILVAPVRGCMASFHPEDSMVINEHKNDTDAAVRLLRRAFGGLQYGFCGGGNQYDPDCFVFYRNAEAYCGRYDCGSRERVGAHGKSILDMVSWRFGTVLWNETEFFQRGERLFMAGLLEDR